MSDLVQTLVLASLGTGGQVDTEGLRRILALLAVQHGVPWLKSAVKEVLEWLARQIKRTEPPAAAAAGKNHTKNPEISARIEVEFSSSSHYRNDMYNALVWKASMLEKTREIKFTEWGATALAGNSPIQMTEDVWLQQTEVNTTTKSQSNQNQTYVAPAVSVTRVTIEVFSFTLDLPALRAFCDRLKAEYVNVHHSELHGRMYYFDEVRKTSQLPEPHLSFTKHPFESFRSFDNLYGAKVRAVQARIEEFARSRAWYEQHGVPYTFGMMLYGPPGTGKTSLIKAVARYMNRHIVSVALRPETTNSQLRKLFLSSNLYDKSTQGFINVPIDKRVIVLEDVDCVGSVVARRENPDDDTKRAKTEIHDAVTMSDLLNVLDGVLETPGRVMVLTTNHPERLDPALIRPGRIDLQVELGRFSADDVRSALEGFFERPVAADVPDGRWTAAEVSNAVMASGRDLDRTLAALRG